MKETGKGKREMKGKENRKAEGRKLVEIRIANDVTI
jgi:hypothetical protein